MRELENDVDSFKYKLVPAMDDATRDAVLVVLQKYNRLRNPEFFERRDQPEHLPRPANAIVLDANGEVAGGLLGETQFAWLKITYLAVAEHARGQGVGRELVGMVEQEAIARGCRFSFVDTMGYQAPKFYEKLGYKVAGLLPNWDSHGNDKFFFMKQLVRTGIVI